MKNLSAISKTKSALFLILCLFFLNTIVGQTKTYTGSNGVWNTAANWSPSGVPGATDAVTIPNGTVTISSNVTVKSISITGTLEINTAIQLTVNNDFTVNSGGTLKMPSGSTVATLVVYGNYTCVGDTNFWKSNIIIAGNIVSPGTSVIQAQGNVVVGGNINGQFDTNGGNGTNQIYAVNPNATVTITPASIDNNVIPGTQVTNPESQALIDLANTVIYGSATACSFTSSANNVSACSGTNAVFTITTTASSPTYQWQVNINDGSGWNNLANNATYSGVTSGSLTISNVSVGMDFYKYRSRITSGGCTNYGNYGVLNVATSSNSVVGAVTGGSTICNGSTSALLTLSGSAGTILRWESSVSPFSSWNTIANTIATYTSSALTQTTQFRAIVQNGTCSTNTSTATTVTVRSAFTSGAIAATGETICNGGTPSTTIGSTTASSGGDNTITYSWKSSADSYTTAISGATSATYLPPSGLTTTTSYKRYAKDGTCNTTPTVSTGTWTVTVNPNLPASVSIVSSDADNTIVTGTSVTFTATPTNGGLSPSYQWQLDGVNVGTNSSSYTTTTLTNSQIVKVIMTSNATPCLTGSPATSNSITTAVVGSPSVAGTVSSNQIICVGTPTGDISLTGNTGTIQWQSSTDNTAFANISGATSPILTTATIGNLSATTYFRAIVTNGASAPATSGTVIVSMGNTTTWNGTAWSNGIPTSTSSVIITGNYNVSSNINACSMTVNNNAIVIVPSGYNISLNGALTVANGSSFTLENNANLIQGGTTNTNSGAIIVKRNSSPLKRLDYTLWSSPVANQNVLAFSPNTVTTRFYNYDSTTNIYTPIIPSSSTFTAAKGLLIRVPNTHPYTASTWPGKFVGVPNNGDYSYNMYYNVPTPDSPKLIYNLVGNPYPSPISMSRFVSDNSSVITGTLYFWRETNGDVLNNSYCTWAGGTFISNSEAQVVDPNGIIQTGQGFFVEAKSASPLLFKNSQREANNANQFFRTAATEERNTIWLKATNAAGAYSQMAVGYISGATQGVDTYDAKYFGGGAIALSSILDNTNYAIQGRALPFDDSDEVSLGFKAKTAGEYSISIDHVIGLFIGNQDIFLKDNLTNITQNLKYGSYTFTSEVGTFNSRFSLVFKSATLSVSNFNASDNVSIVFTNNDNMLTLKNSALDTRVLSVTLFNLLGQTVSTWDVKNENQNNMQLPVRDLASGTYVVKVQTTKGNISKKIIIKNTKMTYKPKETKKEFIKEKSVLADED